MKGSRIRVRKPLPVARGFSAVVGALCFMLCLGASPALAAVGQFGSEGEGAGQFEEPIGIAVNQQSGDVYVADTKNSRVEQFDAAGQFIRAFGWGVSDGSTEAFQVCQAPGPCFPGIQGAGGGQFNRPVGIAVDNSSGLTQGDVYVEDAENHRIERFESDGKFVLAFGQFGSLAENTIAVGSTGTVYVGGVGHVETFSAAGVAEGEIALPEAGEIRALAVDSSGGLYIHGLQSGVRKYDGAGVELGDPRDEENAGDLSLAIGPSDELFVSEPERQHVYAYDASGTQLASVTGEVASGAGGGIAFGNGIGALYVLHRAPASVRLLTLPPPGPVVLEGSESGSELLPTSAKLNATINPEGAPAKYHFEYGTSTAYGESTAIATLNAVNEVQSVSVVAAGGGFTLAFNGEESAEIPFNATSAEVQAALEGVPSLGAGQIAVSGEPGGPWSVEFTGTRGGEHVAELSPNPGNLTGPPEPSASVTVTTSAVSLFDDREVNSPITGLQPATTYHFRVVATNALNQTTFGPDETFTTLPPVSIESESSSGVTATSARLNTVLNAHGLPTEFHFEYGLSSAYGSSAPTSDAEAGESSEPESFSLTVQNLQPASVYHYRVVAHNALGTTDGPDQIFTTQAAEPTGLQRVESPGLLDGRGWELVSPANKHGVSLESITKEGALIQAAQDGDALAYIATGPTDSEPPGNRSDEPQQLLSARTAAGVWSTQDVAVPHRAVVGYQPGNPSEYKLFSSDLTLAVVEPLGATPLSPQTTERTPYMREADGSYRPLVTGANVPVGTKFGGEESAPELFGGGVEFVTATPDLRHLLIKSPTSLVEDFESPGGGAESLYEWSEGRIEPVSILPGGVAAEGAASGGDRNRQERNAISADGSRVFFTVGERLYMRDMTRKETVHVSAAAPGVKESELPARFQFASSNGSRAFFTDEARLTKGAKAKSLAPDLYECTIAVVEEELQCELRDLSVDANTNVGEAASVQGAMLGGDEGGRNVYFVAKGALAPGATSGTCPDASEGACLNLYVYDTETQSTRLVAVLSEHDKPDWIATEGEGIDLGDVTSRVSPNGRYLAFMSQRPLTGYDNRDARSGARDEEVFLYDNDTGKLSCASCDPTGQRPSGVFDEGVFPGLLVDRPLLWAGQWLAGSIPGWTRIELPRALHQSRYLSDSGRLFFNSPGPLVAADTNGTQDVYEYEPDGVGSCNLAPACLGLISSGSSSEETAFLDASETGDDVFFLTAAQLSTADQDNALDIYDAHVCSLAPGCASPAPGEPPPCVSADACRFAPTPQPGIFGAPASSTFSGAGNLAPPSPPKAKPLTRAQKLAKALKACKRKPKRERARCIKQARARYSQRQAGKKSSRSAGKKKKTQNRPVGKKKGSTSTRATGGRS